MSYEEFSALVQRVIEDVGKIGDALSSSPDLLGCLSLEDFQVISGFVKERAWVKG